MNAARPTAASIDAALSPNSSEAARLRVEIRAGRHTGPTAGLASAWVHANVVILPDDAATDFGEFCRRKPRACPLLDRTTPGNPHPASTPGADLRTDVPRYRVFRGGVADRSEPTDIRALWRDDLVAFLLGCSFTFERALAAAGLVPRHLEAGTNVPMYRTMLACEPAGRFAGPLVVSMRPYRPEDVGRVTAPDEPVPQNARRADSRWRSRAIGHRGPCSPRLWRAGRNPGRRGADVLGLRRDPSACAGGRRL